MAVPIISSAQKARLLAEALPFIRAYHATTLVIRLGGGAMADLALKEGFARDVALLRLVGMNPIVVHGGGWRIDELLRQMAIEIREYRGMRVTDEATLKVVEMVLDELNQELVGLINRHGGRAVGLNGQDGRFIRARPIALPPDARAAPRADLGLVGDVESIDARIVQLLVSRHFIPVIMPIGVGTDGTAYHINSDLVAGQLARTLEGGEADPHDQCRGRARSRRQDRVRPHRGEAEGLLDDGAVERDMRPRLTAALAAVREGVRSVHIIDGGVPSALLLEVLDERRRRDCGALRRRRPFSGR